jgi:hypothetical protein
MLCTFGLRYNLRGPGWIYCSHLDTPTDDGLNTHAQTVVINRKVNNTQIECNRNDILLVLELNDLAAAMSADNHVLVQISKQQRGPAFKITNIFKGDRSKGLSTPHVAVSSTWPDLNQIIPGEQQLYRRITQFAARVIPAA